MAVLAVLCDHFGVAKHTQCHLCFFDILVDFLLYRDGDCKPQHYIGPKFGAEQNDPDNGECMGLRREK